MRGKPPRRLFLAAALLTGAVVAAPLGSLVNSPKLSALGAVLLVAGLLVWRPTYSWVGLLTGLLIVILFVPIRRFTLSANLPFELEPYRLVVLVIVAGWLLSLLADPKVRFRRTKTDGAVLAITAAVLVSLVVNPARVESLQTNVVKTVAFFATYVVLYFLITSVINSRAEVDRLIKVMVVGGALVAALAVLEPRLGYNPYESVFARVPVLEPVVDRTLATDRGTRAYGSAQHPIALGAALVMILPLAVALAYRTSRKRWWIAAFLITVASFATLSRTAVVMLATVAVVFFWLRRAEMVRAAPLALVFVVGIHFVIPGALGTMKSLFFPEGGLIAEQSNVWGTAVNPDLPIWCSYAGRAADIGPVFSDASERPLAGYGYGTRITVGDDAAGLTANACVLDNQWLSTLLDVGLLGVLAWAWLFVGFIRRGTAAAREADDDDTAWFFTALVASVAAAAVGMFLFDAFAFIQVMLLLFVVLALGGRALRSEESDERTPATAPLTAPASRVAAGAPR